MKKVLIVGANSYIGNSFEAYMNQYEEIQKEPQYINEQETEKSQSLFIDNNLAIDKVCASNEEWKNIDFSGYDVVLHLAGIAHKKETKTSEVDYYRVNRDLAVDVARKAKASKVEQFIFMSTAAVYGSSATIITQDTIPRPTTYYGKSKLEAEQALIKLHDNNFKVAIVRPPMVYGYGCKGNFNRLVKLAKITPIFPDIQNKRSMIYIDNLCEFLKMLIISEEGGYYHPQNAAYVCTSEMMKIISENVGHKIFFTKVFNSLIRTLARNNKIFGKMFGDWYYEMDKVEENLTYQKNKK